LIAGPVKSAELEGQMVLGQLDPVHGECHLQLANNGPLYCLLLRRSCRQAFYSLCYAMFNKVRSSSSIFRVETEEGDGMLDM
jgi:hypothetical protein